MIMLYLLVGLSLLTEVSLIANQTLTQMFFYFFIFFIVSENL